MGSYDRKLLQTLLSAQLFIFVESLMKRPKKERPLRIDKFLGVFFNLWQNIKAIQKAVFLFFNIEIPSKCKCLFSLISFLLFSNW